MYLDLTGELDKMLLEHDRQSQLEQPQPLTQNLPTAVGDEPTPLRSTLSKFTSSRHLIPMLVPWHQLLRATG